MIPYGRQSIDQQDIDAVVEVLQSDFLTQGPAVPRFEAAIAELCGAEHVVAVNSATSALHVACLALDVKPGDSVWTSPISFVASANCARYCGGVVDFVDISTTTLNMCTERLADKLKDAAVRGKLPKVVIPVHFAGQPCDMREVFELSLKYEFRVIEDASHAIGATYQDTRIGDCRYSDITVFSFHPVKIITTGEGGAACTQSADLARKMQLLRTHGITRDPSELCTDKGEGWYYEQHMLGFNYRMTDIQAALGASQIRHIHRWLTRRHEISDQYDTAFSDSSLITPTRLTDRYSALHLYCVQVPGERRRVFDTLRQAGIAVNVHYIPIHLQPDFVEFGRRRGDYPNAEKYYENAISLPMYPQLTAPQQDFVVKTLLASM